MPVHEKQATSTTFEIEPAKLDEYAKYAAKSAKYAAKSA